MKVSILSPYKIYSHDSLIIEKIKVLSRLPLTTHLDNSKNTILSYLDHTNYFKVIGNSGSSQRHLPRARKNTIKQQTGNHWAGKNKDLANAQGNNVFNCQRKETTEDAWQMPGRETVPLHRCHHRECPVSHSCLVDQNRPWLHPKVIVNRQFHIEEDALFQVSRSQVV